MVKVIWLRLNTQNELLLNLKGSHLYLERANRRIDITSYIQIIKFNFILETNAVVKISKQSKPYIFRCSEFIST